MGTSPCASTVTFRDWAVCLVSRRDQGREGARARKMEVVLQAGEWRLVALVIGIRGHFYVRSDFGFPAVSGGD